jgi:hypothetical protein
MHLDRWRAMNDEACKYMHFGASASLSYSGAWFPRVRAHSHQTRFHSGQREHCYQEMEHSPVISDGGPRDEKRSGPVTVSETIVVQGNASPCYVSVQSHGDAQFMELHHGWFGTTTTPGSVFSHHFVVHILMTIPRSVCNFVKHTRMRVWSISLTCHGTREHGSEESNNCLNAFSRQKLFD